MRDRPRPFSEDPVSQSDPCLQQKDARKNQGSKLEAVTFRVLGPSFWELASMTVSQHRENRNNFLKGLEARLKPLPLKLYSYSLGVQCVW